MGRKSIARKRKPITPKVQTWLKALLVRIQYEDLEQLKIDDIAKLAGTSKSTIYEYFGSKEEILEACCATRINQLTTDVLQLSQKDLDTTDLYTSLVEAFAEGVSDISFSFLQHIKLHYPQAWTLIDQFTDLYVDLLKNLYQKGIEEGLYNAVSIDLLGHIDKLFIIQVVTNPSIFSDEQYHISELIRDYLNLRLVGLLKR